MTLNEILESIGNRTVTWKFIDLRMKDGGWNTESSIKHLIKTELLVKVDKGLYKVGERFKLKPKPVYKPSEPTKTLIVNQNPTKMTLIEFVISISNQELMQDSLLAYLSVAGFNELAVGRMVENRWVKYNGKHYSVTDFFKIKYLGKEATEREKDEAFKKASDERYLYNECNNQESAKIIEPKITQTVNAFTLEQAIELCRSHGIDCSRVTSVQHGNVRVVTRVIL